MAENSPNALKQGLSVLHVRMVETSFAQKPTVSPSFDDPYRSEYGNMSSMH